MPAAILAGARRTAALWRSVRALQDRAGAATPVYGLPALYRLEQLAARRPLTLAGGQSSYE